MREKIPPISTSFVAILNVYESDEAPSDTDIEAFGSSSESSESEEERILTPPPM